MQIVPSCTVTVAIPVRDSKGKPVMERTKWNGRDVEVAAHDNMHLIANVPVEVSDELAEELIEAKLAKDFDPVTDSGLEGASELKPKKGKRSRSKSADDEV